MKKLLVLLGVLFLLGCQTNPEREADIEREQRAIMHAEQVLLLKRELPEFVEVKKLDDAVEVTVPGQYTFESGSIEPHPKAKEVLDTIALVVAEYNNASVRIDTHTDNRGSDEYNKKLSLTRARSIAKHLIGAGLATTSQRIELYGHGESDELESNLLREGRIKNRRFTVTLR